MAIDDERSESPREPGSSVDARCAAAYDIVEGRERDDLDVYAAMVEEFGAASVVDEWCGTGTFVPMLAGRGVTSEQRRVHGVVGARRTAAGSGRMRGVLDGFTGRSRAIIAPRTTWIDQ